MRWILGLSFPAMAGWMLIPDKPDPEDAVTPRAPLGVSGAVAVAFFLAEMADKTQIATIALAVRFDTLAGVVPGTTPVHDDRHQENSRQCGANHRRADFRGAGPLSVDHRVQPAASRASSVRLRATPQR